MLLCFRRNVAIRNGHQVHQLETFNPNHRRYRSCCCHSKTFTLGFGIVELFLICFMLVAIAPDFNSKICERESGNSNGWQQQQQPEVAEATNATTNEAAGGTSNEGNFLPMRRRRRQIGDVNGGGKRKREDLPMGGIGEQQQQQNVVMPDLFGMLAQKLSGSTATENTAAEAVTTLTTTTETTTTTSPMPEMIGEQQQGITSMSESSWSTTGGNEPSTIMLLRNVVCSLKLLWLIWAILQMCSIGLMCYGVKRQRWLLLVPHIFFRLCCALAIWLIISAEIGAFIRPDEQQSTAPSPHHHHIFGGIAICVCLLLVFVWLCCLLKSEIRCCEFIKRSAETGFSVSNTRPLGPATLSHTDSARATENARRMGSTTIRKIPTGPSAKQYQTELQQQQQQSYNRQSQDEQREQRDGGMDGDDRNGEMTMSTLMTAGGLHTRPSTAGSLLVDKNGNNTSMEERRATSVNGIPQQHQQQQWQQQQQDETAFVGGIGDTGDGRMQGRPNAQPPPPSAGHLPPLRHTYKMTG